MTVAAVILSATAEGALAETQGQAARPAPRRPRVVGRGAPDRRAVARSRRRRRGEPASGSEAIHGQPAPAETGPVGQMVRGIELAADEVHDLTAVLLWPARMIWVGPETITSLIEAHGTARGTMLRPAWHGEPGWPVAAAARPPRRAARDRRRTRCPPTSSSAWRRVVPTRLVELGDPGVTHDVGHADEALPDYEGPPDPPAGHTHEWGDDVDLRGRSRPTGRRLEPASRPGRSVPRRSSRTRPIAPVASARPTDDERDARDLAGRRRLAEQEHREQRRSSTGWVSRIAEVRTAGSRGSETWISR